MAAKPIKFLELHYTMIQFLMINFVINVIILFNKISDGQNLGGLITVYNLQSKMNLSLSFCPEFSNAAQIDPFVEDV